MIQKLIFLSIYFQVVLNPLFDVAVVEANFDSFVALVLNSQHQSLPFFYGVTAGVDGDALARQDLVIEVIEVVVVKHLTQFKSE